MSELYKCPECNCICTTIEMESDSVTYYDKLNKPVETFKTNCICPCCKHWYFELSDYKKVN